MGLNKKMLIHALKGNRAQIILAFLFAGCALDTKAVQEWTGLSKPTAEDGLKALKGMGLLGSQALAHNRTVWLPAGDMLELQIQSFFISGPSSSGSNVNELNNINTSLLPPKKSQIQKSFTSGNSGEIVDVDPNPPDPAILKALDAAKIREPKRSQLARLEHVTVELIQGHVKTAPNIGMAIYRIANDWEVPAETGKQMVIDKGKRGIEITTYSWDVDQEAADFTGHKKECTCMDCAVYRTNGERMLCPTCKHYRCECEDENA